MILRAAFLCAALSAGAASAEITAAQYDSETKRYDHGILGDKVEFGALVLILKSGTRLRLTLPETRVFEDLAPRLADLDGDGLPEVIVVETDIALGAQLAVYGEAGKIAATPFIGRTHRWLAPVGAADLDGDGHVEIAYVETPHLGKTLKIVRLEGDRLVPVAMAKGLTNHKIGDPFIQGSIADCDGHPTILTADANWARVMATTLAKGKLSSRDLGRYTGPASLDALAICR